MSVTPSMPARQVWLFQLGSWMALLVAAVHGVVHVIGRAELSAHAQAGLGLLPPRYAFPVPGGAVPTFVGELQAFSLAFALWFLTIGVAGLAVVRRYDFTPRLLRGVAGAFALGTGLMLVASVVFAFSLQTFLLALVPLCFGLAAVPEE